MSLPTGTISMSNVNVELKRPATQTISLNDGQVRQLAGRPSGTISMSDLRGKSFTVPVNVVVFDKEINDLNRVAINYNVYSCVLRVKNENISGARQLRVQVVGGAKVDVDSNGTGDVALLQGNGREVVFSLSGAGRSHVTATLIGEVYV